MNEIVELDFRSADGLEVSLFWHRADNTLTVQLVRLHTEEVFTIPVSPACALDVFRHPYAYLSQADGNLVAG